MLSLPASEAALSGRRAWPSAWCARPGQTAAVLLALALVLALVLTACSTTPRPPAQPPLADATGWPDDTGALPPVLQMGASRWEPVRWADLPGWEQDDLAPAWGAWLASCERPRPPLAALCADVRRLTLADAATQRAWMRQRLQPYRVQPLASAPGPVAASDGLLTGYYEPVLEASRQPRPGFTVPLYAPPAGLAQRRPWFTRQEIDTLATARAALQGREIAYLSDPVDALVLHIQGSGRLRVTEADGSQRLVRLAFAATNDQPYKSVGRYLIDRGELREASWPAIKGWLAANPQRLQELLWSNPRVVFFRQEALAQTEGGSGPRGAQGVALTAGRSIAVDPASIPYGTPVWLVTPGPALTTQRLVLAQDTGSAIRGAVRADFYVGSGAEAGDLAGRLKQPLQLWVFWPK